MIFSKPEWHDELETYIDEFNALAQADADRLNRYARDRKEQNEGRDADLMTAIGDSGSGSGTGSDYGSRKKKTSEKLQRHNIPVPMGRASTVKHAYRIAGRLPDMVVDQREESPEERYRSDTIEKVAWGIHRVSNGDSEIGTGAWDSSEVGAACFEGYFDVEKQMPTFQSIDPAGVLVVRGSKNPHDFERVYRFWLAPRASVVADYRGKSFRDKPIDVSEIAKVEKEDRTGWVTMVQVGTREQKLRFVLECKVPVWEEAHGLGFTPYVVIPNIGPERNVWGHSDYEFNRVLVQYLSRAVSRQADILRAVSGGAYKLTGGSKVDPTRAAEVIEKGGVLPLGREGDIGPIIPAEMPTFANEHVETILRLAKMTGFTPDASWGEGGAGSGSDRGLQLQPLLEFTAMKQLNWSSGLSRLYSMLFKMLERKQAGSARIYGAKQTGARKTPFNLTIGPNVEPLQMPREMPAIGEDVPLTEDEQEPMLLPRTPEELFQGDYSIRFVWQNRIDPDDPAFVTSEVNKFAQGVQSLRSTLERLGVQAPEDEIKLIDQEAQKYPWIRQGMIALLKMQLDSNQQGEGGGAPVDPAARSMTATDAMVGSNTSATDADHATSAFGGLGAPSGYA